MLGTCVPRVIAPILLRKEVIQPHLPIRLPSGVPDSHGVTGGVYKARERIHRGMLIRDY